MRLNHGTKGVAMLVALAFLLIAAGVMTLMSSISAWRN